MKNESSNPLKLMEAYMSRKNYSARTISAYIKTIIDVRESSGKDIHHLTADDFNDYIDDVAITVDGWRSCRLKST
jgi:hypothetical protein